MGELYAYLNIEAGGRDASRSRPKIVIVDNLTPHMFRHTYVKVKSVAVFLGHADVITTLKIYMHLEMQKKTNAISSLNIYFDNSFISVPIT